MTCALTSRDFAHLQAISLAARRQVERNRALPVLIQRFRRCGCLMTRRTTRRHKIAVLPMDLRSGVDRGMTSPNASVVSPKELPSVSLSVWLPLLLAGF